MQSNMDMKKRTGLNAPKVKSQAQVGLLLGSSSPLTMSQRFKLKQELDSGAVKMQA